MSIIALTDEINVENMIYEIRGKQVILDSDLAKLYQCKNGTKTINQAVKRNIERFPKDFYFQLTNEEYENLKFQFGTSRHGGVRKNPYAFTEQGVAMLASVLRTPIAARVSIAIMRAFVHMRHYILENKDILKSLNNINNKLIEHDEKLNYLFSVFDKKEKLFLPGETYDAYSEIVDILNLAQNEIIIIDSYADKTMLDFIRNLNSQIILITSNRAKLNDLELEKFNQQYNNKLNVIKDNTFHDRYFILDKKNFFHVGTSLNYAGGKVFSINKLEYEIIKDNLLDYILKILK